MRTVANADLATGCGTVVVIAPQTAALRRADRIVSQLATLRTDSASTVVTCDAAARSAMGRNGLDPAKAAAAALAGRTQAAAEAPRLTTIWNP